MPLASQCLGYLNRASRQWQPRQVFPASQRTFHSSSAYRKTPVVETWIPSGTKQNSVLPEVQASHPRRLASTSALPPTLTEQRSNTAVFPYEDDNDFNWSDFVATRRARPGPSKLQAARASPDAVTSAVPTPYHNIAQWTHELATARRKDGTDGILQVWSQAMEQHAIHEADGPEADFFYRTVLDSAFPSDALLEQVQTYAEWLVEARGIQWPGLYDRVLSYCLENKQYDRAFQWHMRLVSGFDPGSEAFAALLLHYACKSDCNRQLRFTLRSLYVTSLHRNMYDPLVSGLYEHGKSRLARNWRDLCIRFRDLPQPGSSSQQFLIFLKAYYPAETLILEEQVLEGLDSIAPASHQSTATLRRDSPWNSQAPNDAKPIKDTLGARLFASSWIPVDFAIHALQGLGVHVLGPLCLQSLALRDPSAVSVLSRLKQLEKLNIGTGSSMYSKAIRHFAETDNDELLGALLHTDIHPDVFDDSATQKSILDNAIAAGDRRTTRLLLAIQPAVVQHSVDAASNELLQDHILRQEMRLAVGLMDDMRAMNVELAPDTLETIHHHLLRATNHDVPPTSALQQIQQNVDLASRMSLIRQMVPSKVWQNLIYQLGKSHLLQHMERLALDLVDDFQAHACSKGGFVSIHASDFPFGTKHGGHFEVPVDLPLHEEWHPVTRIFDRNLQASIIQWGIGKGLPQGFSGQLSDPRLVGSCPADFHVARGARLLKELRDRGIPVSNEFVRGEIIRCIAAHLWPADKLTASGIGRQLRPKLREVSDLFNAAMGAKLLPSTAMGMKALLAKARRQHLATSREG